MEHHLSNSLKNSLHETREDSPIPEDLPDEGEFYRYMCPVDHKNNFVSMRGIRYRTTASTPAILIVHDVAERSQMYWEAMVFICHQGFSSYSYDQRGHSADADISGHLDHFNELVTDLLQVASWVRHMHNGVPPIIVGQGYGAIVATEFAAKHPQFITGIVLAAPTLELAWMPGPFKRSIIKFISSIAPRVKVPQGLHPRFSNPLHREVGKTMATRLIQSLWGPRQIRLTFSFARALFEAMDSFEKHFHSIRKPVLILKPGDDEVAMFESMDRITSTHPIHSNISTRTVANVHHNGFTEGKLPMSSILEEVLSWSKAAASRLKTSTP